MSKTLQQFATDLVAAWNSHDLDRAAEFYTPDYVGRDLGRSDSQQGREGIRSYLANYHSAFPDLIFAVDDTIADGDRLALAWTANGTHRGVILNIPATGRFVSFRGVSLLTVRDGKVSQATYLWDVAGLIRSVGLLPEL
jgi:steroid delta-isomerase-like uncharacterized protein